MAFVIQSDPVPLRVDAAGEVRVGNTRVTLYTVIFTFEEGASAEEIVLRYPTLNLADVHSVLGYYLRHREEVRSYMEQYDREADELRQEIEAQWPSAGLRQKLLERLASRKSSSISNGND